MRELSLKVFTHHNRVADDGRSEAVLSRGDDLGSSASEDLVGAGVGDVVGDVGAEELEALLGWRGGGVEIGEYAELGLVDVLVADERGVRDPLEGALHGLEAAGGGGGAGGGKGHGA